MILYSILIVSQNKQNQWKKDSKNYNYYFLENWGVGVSIGLEKLSSKKSVYDIASTDETSLAKYPTITQKNIEEYRATEYRKFGNFNFAQIGIVLKKRF